MFANTAYSVLRQFGTRRLIGQARLHCFNDPSYSGTETCPAAGIAQLE